MRKREYFPSSLLRTFSLNRATVEMWRDGRYAGDQQTYRVVVRVGMTVSEDLSLLTTDIDRAYRHFDQCRKGIHVAIAKQAMGLDMEKTEDGI